MDTKEIEQAEGLLVLVRQNLEIKKSVRAWLWKEERISSQNRKE